MKRNYWLIFLLLLVVQVLLGNFLGLGPYIILSLLPILVLSLPIRYGGVAGMLIAFAAAFAVDFFTNGILGLNVLALVPLAWLRPWIISLVFGSEVYARGEDISAQRQGLLKMSLALLISTAIFFAVYVPVDSAGTRSFGFNLLRWLLSTLLSALVQIFLTRLLGGED